MRLHERLTQRFVDRRTAVLVRDIGARGADALPVTVAADGEVSVGPEPIGHLTGFEFRVDPSARLADKRLLLAAAERRLGDELDRRASCADRSGRQQLRAPVEDNGGVMVVMGWPRSRPPRSGPLAARAGASDGTTPRPPVGADPRRASRATRALARRASPPPSAAAQAVGDTATDPATSAGVRALSAMLADAGGVLPRKAALGAIAHLEQADRQRAPQARSSSRPARRLRAAAAQAGRAALARRAPCGSRGTADARASCRRARATLPAPKPIRAGLRSPIAARGRTRSHRPRRPACKPCPQGRVQRAARPARCGTRDVDRPRRTGLGASWATRLCPGGDTWRWRGRRAPRPDRRPAGSHAFAELAKLRKMRGAAVRSPRRG